MHQSACSACCPHGLPAGRTLVCWVLPKSRVTGLPIENPALVQSSHHAAGPAGRSLAACTAAPAALCVGCATTSLFQLFGNAQPCSRQTHCLFHTCFPVYSLATGTSSLKRSWSCSLAMLVSASPSSRAISIRRRKAPRVCTCVGRSRELCWRGS